MSPHPKFWSAFVLAPTHQHLAQEGWPLPREPQAHNIVAISLGIAMWVFGYGSLMWDNWQDVYGCTRQLLADLPGYARSFNKASVVRWGTAKVPGPTLNLVKSEAATCRGTAFEFPQDKDAAVTAYLNQREGKDFNLTPLPATLSEGSNVTVVVPLYAGPNVIRATDQASGDGT